MESNWSRQSWECLTIIKQKHLINLLALRMCKYMFNMACFLSIEVEKSNMYFISKCSCSQKTIHRTTILHTGLVKQACILAKKAILTRALALMPSLPSPHDFLEEFLGIVIHS